MAAIASGTAEPPSCHLLPGSAPAGDSVESVSEEQTDRNKKRFTEQQIIGFPKEADAAIPVTELCRKHGFGDASFCTWRSKFGGMQPSEAKRLRKFEAENATLNEFLAERGLSKRRACELVEIARSSLRCRAVRAEGDKPDLAGMKR